ncbi:MAG: Rrf2 family transcriptional regulator, partial [Ignavibacteriae bacterium]|nr:Rrf2 family transcriptional regulator [Ignavibacteriota bacterium]
KILQDLVRHNIINSVQGAYGGFEIEKSKISSIKLAQIVNAIDGDTIYNGCGLGLHTCDENHPCPVHDKFKIVREELKNMLENTTLEQLALDIKAGKSFLKI